MTKLQTVRAYCRTDARLLALRRRGRTNAVLVNRSKAYWANLPEGVRRAVRVEGSSNA